MHTVINTHVHIYIVIFTHLVTIPNVTILPRDTIQGAMVGSPQGIHCIVGTVSGVELSSVMISWMGPGGEPITNDSRVTISPTTSSGNNYTSSLQFTYLMEGDEGMYTCNVMILETSVADIVVIEVTGEQFGNIMLFSLHLCLLTWPLHSFYKSNCAHFLINHLSTII